MKRRHFLQTSVATGTSLVVPVATQKREVPKKGFKVSGLASRYAQKIMYGATPIDFKLLSSDTDNQLSVFISTNNLKGYGPPLHVHYTFDEFFCVLDGDFVFLLDGERLSLKPGDTIFIPRNVKHTFDCLNEKPGTLLVSILPGKGMETFFADMGKLIQDHPKPDLVAMQALYKRFDSEILGPPIGVK